MSRILAFVAALAFLITRCEIAVAQSGQAGAEPSAGGGGLAAAARAATAGKASPVADEIEAALARPIKFQFDTTPLVEVIDFFANHFDINIQLDPKGLTDAAVDSQAPVTKSVRKPIPFESALRLILDEFDLTITIHNDVLLVTSKEKADEVLETKVYYVGDLVERGSSRRPNYGPLMNLITSTVQPDSWGDNGGPGGIQVFTPGKCLVISQKYDVQKEIKALLADMRAALPAKGLASSDDGAATTRFTTEVHHLRGASGEQAAEALKRLVAPTTWEGAGGDGMMSVIHIARGGAQGANWDVLLVRQTEEIHAQLDEILWAFNSAGIGGGMGTGGLGGGNGAGGMGGGMMGGGAAPGANK